MTNIGDWLAASIIVSSYLSTPRSALSLSDRIEQMKVYKLLGREMPAAAKLRDALRHNPQD